MSVKQARENLSWLLPPILKQIHEGRYRPPPVRRVYIPKADGSKRPLGVPAVVDRAIQGAMAKVLNEIYEQDFLKCSFGFRQGLGCHHALATINELLYRQNMEHVLEVDIRDFFGSLSHEWLMRFLGLQHADLRLYRLGAGRSQAHSHTPRCRAIRSHLHGAYERRKNDGGSRRLPYVAHAPGSDREGNAVRTRCVPHEGLGNRQRGPRQDPHRRLAAHDRAPDDEHARVSNRVVSLRQRRGRIWALTDFSHV